MFLAYAIGAEITAIVTFLAGFALLAIGARQEDAGRRPFGRHEESVISLMVGLYQVGNIAYKSGFVLTALYYLTAAR